MTMTTFPALRTRAAGAALLALSVFGLAHATEDFDFSPGQPGRDRVEKGDAAIAANSLIADGADAKILGRWQLSEEALPKSETNQPGLPKY